MLRRLSTAFLILFIFNSANAENAKLKLDRTLPLKIDYEFPGWNKDPKAIDNAIVIFRDADSGKYAKVNLEETDVNSGIFKGIFSINWNASGEVSPEVFIPPQRMAKKEKLESLTPMIQAGEISRKPYFLRKENNQQLLTIFNSKDQALAAFSQFRKNIKGVPVVDQAALEAQKRAEAIAEAARLAAAAAKQEALRLQMEQSEKARIEELRRQEEAMNEAEKKKRQDQALKLAEEALALYTKEQYPEAEKKFKQAIDLDPNNRTYFFQYGVTLFKIEKYNDSLVALEMAEGANVNPYEKKYFQGLNHIKLKEFDNALSEFAYVKSLNDDKLAPAAAFFAGVIHFTSEDYKPARTEFEYTLDKSADPRLDEQAETYIDQIANMEQFLEKKAKPFTLNLNGGLQYDSNVLLQSDSSSSGSALDKAGFRGTANASLDYRMIYNDKHELQTTLSYNDQYTTNTSLKPVADLQNADLLMMGLKVPYKYKGMLFGKGYQVTVSLGYETLLLNADGESPREVILNSNVLTTSQTFIVNQDYFTTLGINYRTDDSQLPEPTGTDNDGTKITISSDNTMFMDSKKTTAYLFGASYEMNTAKGDDATYNKIGLSGGYLTPYKWGTSLTGSMSYNMTDYNKSSANKLDKELGLNAGLSKPLGQNLMGTLSYTYTNNQSNVDSSTYSKFTLTALLNWTLDF